MCSQANMVKLKLAFKIIFSATRLKVNVYWNLELIGTSGTPCRIFLLLRKVVMQNTYLTLSK